MNSSSWRHHDIMSYQMKTFSASLSFVRGIHRWPVDDPHIRTVTRTFEVPLLSVWKNCWTNTRLTGNSRRHDGHLTSLWSWTHFSRTNPHWFLLKKGQHRNVGLWSSLCCSNVEWLTDIMFVCYKYLVQGCSGKIYFMLPFILQTHNVTRAWSSFKTTTRRRFHAIITVTS